MKRLSMLRAWQAAVSLACLVVLFLWQAEFRHRMAATERGSQGSLGLAFERSAETAVGRASHQLRVQAVDTGSTAAGAVASGALLRFDRPFDPWRRYAPGEAVDVALMRAGAAPVPLTLRAAAVPVPRADAADSLARLLLALPAVVFCLVLAFKGGRQDAHRSLSLCFLAMSLNVFVSFNYLPAGLLLSFGKLANLATYPLTWYLCVRFTLRYQSYLATPARLWITRAFPAYQILAFACSAYALWFGCGFEAPGLGLLTLAVAGGGLVLSAASLAEGGRQSSGQLRQRHRWLLLSIMAGAVPGMAATLPGLDAAGPFGLRLAVFSCYAGLLLMYAGLAYGVLRHRVFNFQFAFGRAVVYSIVSTLLVCCIGLAEWLAAPLLNDPQSMVRRLGIASAAVALLTYLAFHLLHHKLEHAIEKLLFRQWHKKEQALREFIRRAAHITTPDRLLAAFAAALDDFTSCAGAAIYLPAPDGSLRQSACTLPGAPAGFTAEQSRHGANRGQGLPGILPGQLVMPMSHRGRLDGLVIVGARIDAESYRPDECQVIAFAAQQVGLDLDALRLDQLERDLAVLEREAAQHAVAWRLLAGRRAGVRSVVTTAGHG